MSFPVYVTQLVGNICLHIADIWHPFPYSFANMCSSTSLTIRGLLDKVLWRSIACIFCRLHTDPSLTPPRGWLPPYLPPPTHHHLSCMFSPVHWHVAGSLAPQIQKKKYSLVEWQHVCSNFIWVLAVESVSVFEGPLLWTTRACNTDTSNVTIFSTNITIYVKGIL